jgi:hypothetical protein
LDDAAALKFRKEIDNNKRLQKLSKEASVFDKLLHPTKKQISDPTYVPFTEEEKDEIRDKRGAIRSKINPITARLAFDFLESRFNNNKKKVLNNILTLIGFSNDEQPLIAIVSGKNKKLITRHPDLDLRNVKIKRTAGVGISFVNSATHKPIIEFFAKEGEKKVFSGFVDFRDLIKKDS